MTEVDHVQVVREMWPTIGPHTAESLGAGAVSVAEIIRTLAHATRQAQTALPYAPDGYVLLGHLSEAASSEAQVLEQLAGWVDVLADDPTLYHDAHPAGTDLSERQARRDALEAVDDLREAARHAAALAQSLRTAHARISHLGHRDDA
ncbi:hypothetical protein [Streptomyces roseolus]|uniref:hypothetical protein n=1 Tax=Streptomyces roseolus TaxID=67358 RepID=UPI00365622A6